MKRLGIIFRNFLFWLTVKPKIKRKRKIPIAYMTEKHDCAQVAIKTIIDYCEPKNHISLSDIKNDTNRKEGLGTWEHNVVLYFLKREYEVVSHSVIDYDKAVTQGIDYFIEINTDVPREYFEVYRESFEDEIEIIKSNLNILKCNEEKATIEDLIKYLEEGYLIIMLVNFFDLLHTDEGFSGHFVIIHNFNENYFFLINPTFKQQKYFCNLEINLKYFQDKLWSECFVAVKKEA